ncbi:ThuA domain-containing protein [Lentisphaera profundi]|uniref:ThuA domain-containing protein n=1 Tax=Lentisphaera profundi TaxID=1658616 RepID=A0ABY7VQE6_9BACT|nr:PVC-type heme-binding CxxCH protein [Lentisphaera profundi]WDE96408.1 ThuA domain-containing protein [Lentisphaera profundi]
MTYFSSFHNKVSLRNFSVLLFFLLASFSYAEQKKILFLAGARSHGPGQHEHRAGSMILADALNKSNTGFDAKVIHVWPKDESEFDNAAAVVIYADAGGRLTQEKLDLLDKKVKAGMGIMFIHYGVHPSKKIGQDYFTPWIGGFFEKGFSVNPHWTAELIPKADHPVSRGINKPIIANDEFYYNMRFPSKDQCQDCYPLAQATLKPENVTLYNNLWHKVGDDGFGKKQTLMWCRDPKTAGRGVGFTGGHNHRNWAIPGFRKMVLNAIAWVSRSEVPKDGIASTDISQEQLNENLDSQPRQPLTVPTDDEFKTLKPMLRPADPPNYNQKAHYALIKKIAAEAANKKEEEEEEEEEVTKPHVAIENFDLPEDLEITLWADSKQLRNPIAMDMDAHGRMWLTEGVNYRRNNGREPKGDRVMVLQDSNGDGTADKSHVFVQDKELIAPLGLAVFGNRIVVSQPPHLLVYTDVDNNLIFDPSIDKKEVLLTGFNGQNHDHSLHSVIAGPSGKWYINQGNCGAQVTDKSGKTFRVGSSYKSKGPADSLKISGQKSDDGHVWVGGFIARMNPDGTQMEIVGHNMRNSHEHTVNSMGEIFQSDNDDPPACRNAHVLEYGSAGFFSHNGKLSWESDRRPGQSIPVAHWRQEDPGFMPSGDVYGSGAPTGVAFYENGALASKYNGMYLAADAGQRTIFKYFPKTNGATYQLERGNLLKAKNTAAAYNFRPSDIEIGADGALYVSDWYDPRVGGHADQDEQLAGAIYRIAPKNWKVPSLKPDTKSLKGLIELLKSPSDNVRFLAIEALKKQGPSAIPELKNMLNDPNPWISLRPIWIFPFLGAQGLKECESLLKSNNPQVRLVAYKALRRADQEILAYAQALSSDPSALVRRELATSLRNHSFKQKSAILETLYDLWDGKDRAYMEAMGLALTYSESDFWNLINKNDAPESWTEKFTYMTWRLHPPQAIPALLIRAQDLKLNEEQRRFAIDTIAFTEGALAPETMLKIYELNTPEKAYAQMWFNINLDGNKWDGLIDRNLIADKVNIVKPGNPMPYTHPDAPKKRLVPAIAEIKKLKGHPQKGKLISARCLMCHKIADQGQAFGPSLNGWGKQRSSDEILNAIINPDADIAHGFYSSRVLLKNGEVIDGLVKSGAERAWHFVNIKGADSYLVIKTAGGTTQKISWRYIKSVKQVKHSMMLYPEALGLTQAQDFADLAAYLKSL